MSVAFTAALVLIGSSFALLAALGLVRLPDLYTRIQAATKATTLGALCLVAATVVHFQDSTISFRAILIAAFLFLTAPVAAHMIGRAGYLSGVPLWEQSVMDALHGRYDRKQHSLRSEDERPGREKRTGVD